MLWPLWPGISDHFHESAHLDTVMGPSRAMMNMLNLRMRWFSTLVFGPPNYPCLPHSSGYQLLVGFGSLPWVDIWVASLSCWNSTNSAILIVVFLKKHLALLLQVALCCALIRQRCSPISFPHHFCCRIGSTGQLGAPKLCFFEQQIRWVQLRSANPAQSTIMVGCHWLLSPIVTII